jgi:hypothetical protein
LINVSDLTDINLNDINFNFITIRFNALITALPQTYNKQQLLLTVSKNSNQPVLKHVQPHEISFSTSVTEIISWVDACYNITASCVLHVINNYAVIIFASYIA